MPWKTKQHRPAGARSERERKAEFDAKRGSAAARGYDSRWRKLRASVLADEPLCRMCLEAGYTTPASEVDHIIPARLRRDLFYTRTNLQALCKSHHSQKTATEDSTFAKKPAGNADQTKRPKGV